MNKQAKQKFIDKILAVFLIVSLRDSSTLLKASIQKVIDT